MRIRKLRRTAGVYQRGWLVGLGMVAVLGVCGFASVAAGKGGSPHGHGARRPLHVSRSARIDAALRSGGRHAMPALVKRGAKEMLSLRTARSDTFVNPDGTRVLRSFAEPVNYRDARGRYVPISNTLVSTASGFRNRANSVVERLPSDLSRPVSVAAGGEWVSFALVGGHGRGDAHGTAARFSSVLPSVDATYTVENSGLKEALTLRDVGASAVYEYRLGMSTGLAPRSLAGGAIVFVDRNGRVQYLIPQPFVYDAGQSAHDGSVSPVSQELRRVGGGWVLRLVVSGSWLRAPGRRFPVTVDPSVFHEEDMEDTRLRQSGADQDCYIKDGSFASSSSCGLSYIDLGWHTGVQRRMLLQFNVQNQLPSRTKVLDAQLGLDLTYESGSGSSQVELHRLTHSWTTGATWNAYNGTNGWTSPGGDFDSSVAASTTISTLGWYTWYPRALVQSWVNGSVPNDGFLVKQTTERSLDNDYSFDDTEACSTTCPYLDVVYEPQTGQPGYYHYEQQQLTDKGGVGVNVASGNLLVSNNDLHLAGTGGMALAVNRYFNNQWERSTQDVGTGWTLGLGADVNLRFLTDGTAVFDGSSGYEVDFAQNSSGIYTSPSGVDATLCSVAVAGSGACPSDTGAAYALTMHPSERRMNFDSHGNLTSEQDRNGNKISYAYGSYESDGAGVLSQITDTKGKITTVSYNGTGQIQSITDSTGRSVSYGYTAGDWGQDLTSYTDANRKTTTYGYTHDDVTQITDPNGNVTKIRTVLGSLEALAFCERTDGWSVLGTA